MTSKQKLSDFIEETFLERNQEYAYDSWTQMNRYLEKVEKVLNTEDKLNFIYLLSEWELFSIQPEYESQESFLESVDIVEEDLIGYTGKGFNELYTELKNNEKFIRDVYDVVRQFCMNFQMIDLLYNYHFKDIGFDKCIKLYQEMRISLSLMSDGKIVN